MGTNWKAWILAYLEQTALTEQLEFKTGMFASDWFNNMILKGLVVRVPDVRPARWTVQLGRPWDQRTSRGPEARLCGTRNGLLPIPWIIFPVTPITGYDWLCNNGLLPRMSKWLCDATDGGSNTIIVSEQWG